MENLCKAVSGTLPFLLLIAVGLYLTFKGGFFQFKGFLKSLRLTAKAVFKNRSKGEMTSFQAAATALSATVGTGNIAGVAGAISLGGAGAVFWMWVTAVLGMAVKYAEITLGVKYRERKDGKYEGGPSYYIKNGLKNGKILSYLFAFCLIPASFCTGNLTQTNSAVCLFAGNTGAKIFMGILFALAGLAVISGGKKRIGAFSEKVAPIMSLVYIILCFGVIIPNIRLLPSVFFRIIDGAFCPKAVTGGAVGSVSVTVLNGAMRGVFSNEAGLGTSSIVHSSAYDADIKNQGYFGIFEVFADTVCICTLTALTILISGVTIKYGTVQSTELVTESLKTVYGTFAKYLIFVMMSVFAVSSIVGWAAYGESASAYLFGNAKVFRILYPLSSVLGAVFDVSVCWSAAALFNGIMMIINLPAIFILSEDTGIERKNFIFKGNTQKRRSGACNKRNKPVLFKRFSFVRRGDSHNK